MQETTRKELIEQERMAAVDEVVVTINHEINNPLTTIINYAHLLQVMNVARNQTEMIRGVKKILDAALRIKNVTHKLSSLENTRRKEYLPDINMIDIQE